MANMNRYPGMNKITGRPMAMRIAPDIPAMARGMSRILIKRQSRTSNGYLS